MFRCALFRIVQEAIGSHLARKQVAVNRITVTVSTAGRRIVIS